MNALFFTVTPIRRLLERGLMAIGAGQHHRRDSCQFVAQRRIGQFLR